MAGFRIAIFALVITMMQFETKGKPFYAEPISGFNDRSAMQLCAYFLMRADGEIEKLKLIKLLYLTERTHFAKFGEPIMWDEFYSLPHGPICSSALNIIDKVILDEQSDQYFVLNGRREVHLTRRVDIEEFDSLSRAAVDSASEVWAEHGSKTASQLRNFTHEHCEEYVEVERGRVPISYEAILSAVGYDGAEETAHEIDSYRGIIARYG